MHALSWGHQETDQDEGAILMDSYQAPYTPFSSDIDHHDIGGFVVKDKEEEDSEVKLRRKNIANEMWKSYLHDIASEEIGSMNDDFLDAMNFKRKVNWIDK